MDNAATTAHDRAAAAAALMPDLPRTIGTWSALAIMIGIIIGGGIFGSPTVIAAHLAEPWLVLAAWLAGGLLALCGALTYAELATMYPHSGGVYVFLREGYGRGMAFVFGWTYLLISKPLAAGGIAIIFGENVNALLGTTWPPENATIASLVLLTGVNLIGMHVGAGVALLLTGLKVGALVAIVVLGLALGGGDISAARSAPVASGLLTALIAVMTQVMWTYDGWSDVGAIAGEIRDPQRRLPRIYAGGTLFITALYLLVNLVYLRIMPLEEMRTISSVAPVVVERLIGGVGAGAVTLIILISTLGSTHGSIISGARVSFAQAREGLMFRSLAAIHPTFATPHVSLLVQLALAIVAVLYCKTFESLTGGFVFTMWIFYGLAGAAIFILRARLPDAPRAYRCWGYPLVPLLFVLTAAGMTLLSIYQALRPLLTGGAAAFKLRQIEPLIWLAVLLGGVPVYYIWDYFTRRAAARRERIASNLGTRE